MQQTLWENDIFRLAVEASPSGQLIVNQNGEICHVNSKISEIFGYSSDELVGQTIEKLIPSDYSHQHASYRNGFFKKPTVRRMGSDKVLFGLHKTSKMIPVEVGLNPLDFEGATYVLASVVDISERLKAEKQFQLTLEASPNGVLLMNSEGNIVLVNSRIEEIFGYPRAELIGESVSTLVPSQHRSQHPNFIKQFLAHPKSRAMGVGRDLYGLRKDASEVPLEIGINPLEIGGEMHVLASVVDISERKQAEEERLSLNDQIQHAQRLESLGVLAGGTAHDFNNILQTISGNAEIAKMTARKGGDPSAFLDNIVESCQRASDLTKQMLAYAGKGRMVCSDVSLNRLVDEISTLICSTIPKKISLVKRLADNLPILEADTSQFQQIIMNLMTNSAEAIGDEAGSIIVSTGTEVLDEETLKDYKHFDYLKPGNYLFLEVEDTGKGMAEDVLNSMFDPFFTTKFTGRGLGMAAVLGIVRSHKGTVSVSSAVGKGTKIRFAFPVPDNARLDTEYQPVVEADDAKWVLLIDDEADVNTSLGRLLELDGYKVVAAQNGREGIKTVDDEYIEFDVILLDMNMPGMSGAEVYAELDKRQLASKTVLMSGYNEEEVISAIKNTTGNQEATVIFLNKPFAYEELSSLMQIKGLV